MLKRTLYFSNPYHLNTENKQLIITNKTNGEVKQTPIEDIGFIIFEHPHITFTQSVMQFLTENNTAVVFCDDKHLPSSLLLNLESNHLQNEIFAFQIAATEPLKKQLWKQTIESKIKNQATLLKKYKKEYKFLIALSQDVKSGDTTNREAVAAKYYWKNLFDIPDFFRDRYGFPPNNLLNYGYAILRAAVARSLTGSGLLPTLGIHHHNRYNAYCLADDIMEAYRPWVDEIVLAQCVNNEAPDDLTKELKAELLGVLSCDTKFEKVTRPLMVGLSITTASLAKCYEGEIRKIEYPEFE